LIARVAREVGVPAELALAVAAQESDLDPNAVGDNGKSVGLFQLHEAGMGSGMGNTRYDPEVNARTALGALAATIRANPTLSPGTLAARSQRPADPLGYARAVDQKVRQFVGGVASTVGSAVSAVTGPRGQAPSPPAAAGRVPYAFPVVGYAGKSVPVHWGSNDPGARGGADLMAPEGTPVVAMAPGTVQWANYDQTGGNTVGVLGDDGNTYYYAHLRDPSALRAGQRVAAGTPLGAVGKTGNAGNGPSHLHIGIGKGIQTGSGPLGGLGKDYDAVRLLNDTLVGGTRMAGGDAPPNTLVPGGSDWPSPGAPGGPGGPGGPPKDGDKEDKRDTLTRMQDARKATEADIARHEQNLKTGDATAKYNAEQALPGLRATLNTLNSQIAAEENRLRDEANKSPALQKGGDGKWYRWDPNKKDAQGNPAPGYVPVEGLPPDADATKDTFYSTSRGIVRVSADGKTVSVVPGTEPLPATPTPGAGQRTVDTYDPDGTPVTLLIDAEGRIIQRFRRQAPANERNRTRTVETFDEQGNPITALVDDDQGGKIIARYPRQGKEPTTVSAPRDAEYIVRQGSDGKLTVDKNPNFDATSRDLTGINAGRVYRVRPDGTAQLTDTLTPEERAIANRTDIAKATGAEATAATGIIDAATKLHDAEMKDREAKIWGEVQKVLADPNATADQIWGVIQAGASDAKQWTDLFREHLNQKTQEEVARHNRVAESVSVQEADRQLREGLYKDINETRNQRTLAQQASNQAQSRGIIGLANSANVLSAMAPLVGTEGIKGIGTLGLGVGEEAIGPVVKSWEEHQAELQRLRDQMPAVRMANPNVPTPSFAIPRGTPAGVNIPPVVQSDTTKNLIDKANQLLGSVGKGIGASGTGGTAGAAGQAGQGIGSAAGAATQAVAAGAQPNIIAVDLESEGKPGRAQQFQVSPTGERTPWGEEYDINQPEAGGGGYTGGGRPRFRVPGRKRTTRAA